ncbi:major capsid protein [Sphingomonas sp.]|uniref:major capsid protein n=1 Tax=Sphingomonas sp. TaxID=28214 RepID=UPI0035C7DD63
MAVLGVAVPTLVDVLGNLNPDGSQADIAEVLNKTNPILADMPFYESNLPTGHSVTIRSTLPQPNYRALNEGVPLTKSTATQFDEPCAQLEDFSQVDRKLAMLSGNVDAYRLKEARPHMEGMNQQMTKSLVYGNTLANQKEFTGFMPRYNSKSGVTGGQVIDAGGTGSNLRSILLVGWGEGKVYGIYPKGTMGGLQHEDATSPSGTQIPGTPAAMVLRDASGNPYMGYMDHWEWNTGLVVEDWRYVVRIANIDVSALTVNHATGAYLQDLMIQAVETIQDTAGVNPKFYMPRIIRQFFRRQLNDTKNTFLSMEDSAGQKVMAFGEVEVKRLDAMNVAEARVI